MDPRCPPPPLQPANNRVFGGGLQIPASHNLRPGAGHRRAHSETFLSLPDDLLLESYPDFSISDLDIPSLSDEMDTGSHFAVEFARSDPPQPPHPKAREETGKPVPGAHLRSLSVDAAFFDGLAFQGPSPTAISGIGGETSVRKGQHRRSGSMDGPTSSFEDDSGQAFPDYSKKAMPADQLAELSLIDPKRAKRILANRQSAARSKERKILYTSELERKVHTLQTEATTLSAQLTLLQRDTTGLTAENRELKLRLQAMEQQAQLREALNDALREEVQRLRIATVQFPNANGNPFSGGSQQSVSSFTHSQQLPPRSNHHAQHRPPSQPQSYSNGLTLSNQSNDPMDFM